MIESAERSEGAAGSWSRGGTQVGISWSESAVGRRPGEVSSALSAEAWQDEKSRHGELDM